MTKLKSILAAAALTVTAIVAVFILNVPDLSFLVNSGQTEPVAEITPTEVDEEYAAALEARQNQLEDAQSLMTERQTGYQEQIEAAELVIADLEAQIEAVQTQMQSEQELRPQLETEYQTASGYSWQQKQQRDALAAKEAEYAAQLEAANQTILALQAQINQMAGH